MFTIIIILFFFTQKHDKNTDYKNDFCSLQDPLMLLTNNQLVHATQNKLSYPSNYWVCNDSCLFLETACDVCAIRG